MKNGVNKIFPLNAETDMAATIRHKICKSYIKASCWYSLQLEFEQLQNRVVHVTKSACIEICISHFCITEFELSRSNFEVFSRSYNYPLFLPDLIFLYPQPLFKKLSELISVSFANGIKY